MSTPNEIVFFGIDPGSHFLGLSYVSMDLVTKKILRANGFTLRPSNMFVADVYSNGKIGDLEADDRIALLLKEVDIMVNFYNPTFLAIEKPFYNRRAPFAYGVLLSQLLKIVSHFRDNYPHVGIAEYSPLYLKKSIGAKKMKGKDPVRMAVEGNLELVSALEKEVSDMSEHEIDALVAARAIAKDIGEKKCQ